MRSKCAEKSPFSGLMSRALLDSVCVVVRESCLVSSPVHVSRKRSSLLSWPRCFNWHQSLGPLDPFYPPNISRPRSVWALSLSCSFIEGIRVEGCATLLPLCFIGGRLEHRLRLWDGVFCFGSLLRSKTVSSRSDADVHLAAQKC